MRRRIAGLCSLGLVEAFSPLAIAGPFYFAEVDYDGRAVAAWSTPNDSGRSDGAPGFGFQQSDQPGPFDAGNHLTATVSPDGNTHADAQMTVDGRVQANGAIGASVNGVASGVALSSDFFNDMYQTTALSGGRATVTWNDRFEVDDSDYAPGEPFFTTAHVTLDGGVAWAPAAQYHSANCSGFSQEPPTGSYTAVLDASGTGMPLPPGSQRGHWGIWSGDLQNGQLFPTTAIDPPSDFEWRQPVFNGQLVPLTFSLTVGVDVRSTVQGCTASPASGSLTYSLAFAHTLAWGGITSITDASGNPVQDWTVTSLSGFDYAHAAVITPVSGPGGSGSVPEPATVLLVTAAFGTLGLGRRARKQEDRGCAAAAQDRMIGRMPVSPSWPRSVARPSSRMHDAR